MSLLKRHLVLIGLAGALLPSLSHAACPSGQEMLDGKACVSVTPWAAKTALPDGTRLAIKLRTVMRNYHGGSEPWPKWVGVSAKDNATLAATDDALTSRNLFTVRMFMPAGAQYYDLPWFTMKASNGKYVGSVSGTGGLAATIADEANADLFARYWNSPSQFGRLSYKWKDAATYLDQVKKQGNYYILCLSPFNVSGKMDGTIGQWLSGPAPNYGCSASANMDYYVVR